MTTGLGLPLAKAFMEMHGGALMLDSTPGIGTKVTIVFPRERLVCNSGAALRAAACQSAA